MILLKNARVFSPEDLGNKDILISFDKVYWIDEKIDVNIPKIKVIDLGESIITPGFVDLHVHFAGAGGEGSPINRTRELTIDEIISAGITTAIGLLGTDGYTRSMLGLLQKAYALELQGLSTYIYSGSYQIPPPTITGSVAMDIIAIEKVIGVGEVAISDHRSSWPTVDELIRLASEIRVAGMLSGKKAILHLHTGKFPNPLGILREVFKRTNIPKYHFLPTHMNRDEEILKEALKYCLEGGYVDLTAVTKDFSAADGVKYLLDNGASLDQITISSDSGGSLPRFDANGNLIEMAVASPKALFEEFLKLKELIGLEKALKILSTNPAERIGLKMKGRIEEGADADLLVFDNEFNLKGVISKGKILKGGDVF
ncbi:MAG: beta-aspartyl-peptidase [Synergistetes bacterium]|nr:beta-aspartyl-peptidase [Synergistota bacterium]